MPGMWQHYYTRWNEATREHLDLSLLELLPALAKAASVTLGKSHCVQF
jgi:hypothetical protein